MTFSKSPVHAINKRVFKSVKRSCSLLKSMAERVGFEPTSYAVDFSVFRVDNRVDSTLELNL